MKSALRFSFLFFTSLFFSMALADLRPETQKAQLGGAILEYPSGRYQEKSSPHFFSWRILNSAETVNLKVFQINNKDTAHEESKPILNVDLTGKTKSYLWPGKVLPKGQYYWQLETYSSQSSKPLNVDKSYFSVVDMSGTTLRTTSIGALLGFGRGSYTGIDPKFESSFDTTPRGAGVVYFTGTNNSLFEVRVLVSDFTLASNVKTSAEATISYSYKIAGLNPYKYELFIGPRLRYFEAPQSVTDNNIDFTLNRINAFSPGLLITAQKLLNYEISFFSKLYVDMPVSGNGFLESDSGNMGYGFSIGGLYGMSWPIGVGGEVGYKHDTLKSNSRVGIIDITVEELFAKLSLFYSF